MKTFLTFFLSVAIAGLLFTGFKPAPAMPKYKHIVVVIEENHSYNELIGSVNSPYITKLAKRGVLFTDSHGVTHPSQPNYLALFSGSTQGVTDDICLVPQTPYTTPNLGAALISKGLTFIGYAQTMPSVGYLPCVYKESTLTVGYLYARKHAPWVNWQGTGVNNIPASVSLPMTMFPKNYNKLPTISFVIPDMDYDMHNIGAPGDAAAIQRGDKWLKENIDAYARWAKTHNSLLIVTFDEDDSRSTANQVPTIFYGAHLKTGEYSEKINHYNILHTLEAIYGLPVTDNTGAEAIKDVWK